MDMLGRNAIFDSPGSGMWVSILMDEEEKPSIGGIPQSLKDRFGDAVNDWSDFAHLINTAARPRTPPTVRTSNRMKPSM
jgi:hypothetical protein